MRFSNKSASKIVLSTYRKGNVVSMKRKLLYILPIVCLFFSSCFDVEETYQLNNDGSYQLTYNFDMGRLLRMTNMLMPDSIRESAAYNLKQDTVFNLAAIPDSIKVKMSAKELQILSLTKMRTKIDLSGGLFEVNVQTQGKSIEDLKYFIANFNQSLQKSQVSKTLTNTSAVAKNMNAESFPEKEAITPFQNKEYDYLITGNSFERKIRPEMLLAGKEKSEDIYTLMKEMEIKMNNTITINLPRPAISVENPKAVLSADRKQVKLVIDMVEATAHPQSLNFKVTY